MRIRLATLGIALLSLLILPGSAVAQAELVSDTVHIQKAVVTSVNKETTELIGGTDTAAKKQSITVKILSGDESGKEVTLDNDYTQLTQGEVFYLRHTTNDLDGTDYYTVSGPYRVGVLAFVFAVFVVLVAIFGGKQGVRGLASLGGSIALIFYVLIPGILHGYSPILVSVGIAALIILVGSYITHGFNRTTTAAVLGMLATVLVTGAVAYWVVHAAHLNGYNTEESVYLNFNTHGTLDLVGLLFGGIMIGLLGVLYDIAISQAIAVEELYRAGAHMTRIHVYQRAVRIGREHIGALVNTLAIAYVGAALPLLLLVQSQSYGFVYAINSEIFATEIVRVLIGSIGLVLGVPITTLIAVSMLKHFSGKGAGQHEGHHSH